MALVKTDLAGETTLSSVMLSISHHPHVKSAELRHIHLLPVGGDAKYHLGKDTFGSPLAGHIGSIGRRTARNRAAFSFEV
jgi:hypothetical protein